MDAHSDSSASSRSKAAAWAWYQRAGCRVGLSAARPEAFASSPDRQLRPPPSPSRFKLEAPLLLASLTNQKQEAKAASVEAEGLVSFLLPAANLRTDVNYCPTEIDPPRTSVTHKKTVSLAPDDDDGISSSSTNLVLALSYAGMAAWDCGSSLFDSFELVAVSKKLECAHQFNAFSMDKVCPPAPNITSAALDEQQEDEVQPADSVEALPCNEPAFFLSTAWVNVEEPPIGVPRPHGQVNSEFELTSNPDQKHRKQEVYEMFCRYDCTGQMMNCGCDDVNYDDVKKPKPSPASRQAQHRMPRLRRLSKAFRRMAHLAHSSSDAHREHSLSQRPHLQSHRLRRVPSPETQQLLPHYNRISLDGTARNPPSGGPFRDHAPADDKYSDHMQKQQQQHHHHYHYLFHHDSDEGFGALQPTAAGADKSFMVAAAGLRTPKVSAHQRHPRFYGSSCKMDGAVLDYKRKWRDLNAASPPQSTPSTV